MTTIADLKRQLEEAETTELAALALPEVLDQLAAVDRRTERLSRQLADERARRAEIQADRDERIRRGGAAGLSTSRLAEAAGVARSRITQILDGAAGQSDVPADAEEPEVPAA